MREPVDPFFISIAQNSTTILDCCSDADQYINRGKSTEDTLFDMFRDEETDLIHIGKFLAVSIKVTIVLVSFPKKEETFI